MLTTFFREEHEIFRKTLREFIEKELAPHTDEWEKAEIFPREVFKKAGQMGFLGAPPYPRWTSAAPAATGGTPSVWGEEHGALQLRAGVNMALAVQSTMATPIINEIGTREQKDEFLVPALAGDKIAALGISEPNCGSDVASIRTTAKKVGSDYVINGAKCWITNGTRADFITLAVRTGQEGYGGISLVLFPTDVKGLQGRAQDPQGGRNHASDTAEPRPSRIASIPGQRWPPRRGERWLLLHQ